jgi:hypothetical protein
VRMNPVVRPRFDSKSNRWVALRLTDDPAQDNGAFRKLRRLELDAVKQDEVALISRLGRLWIDGEAVNQPIRASADYTCEIGHPTFAQAKEAWWKITGLKAGTPQNAQVA